MPQAIPKWDDIASSERFRALPSEQQESLRGAYFTDFVAPSLAPESVGKARQEWDALTSPKNQPGVWSDIKNTLSMGFQGLALDAREVARRTFGERFVGAVDSVDEWMHGQPSEELLKGKIAQAQQALTPQMQAALSKEWWNDETNSPGEAWSDPRAYLGGVMQSLPGTVITMAPALGIAKGMYAAEIARGATQAVAAARAATAAQIAGGLTEGLQQAGQTGREVREQILGLSEADLADSQALGTLMDGGLSFEDARAKLAEDASAKAMTLAGVATGIFGGTGDRVLAKAFTKGLSGNLAARIAKGAAAEGLLEELPQSGLSRMAANVGLREAQPDTPITKGALGEALGGAVMGGLMGGGMATVSRQAEPVERTVNKIVSAPDADTAIAAATSSLDQALQTADTVAQNILPPEGIIRRAMPPAPIPEGLPELPGSQEADLRGLAQAGRAARYDTAFNALEPAQDAAKQTELDALATESKVPAALYDAETADRVAAVAGQTEAQPTAMQLALQRAQERAQAKQATPVAAEAPQAPPAPASQASDDVIPLTKLFRREQLAEDETRRMIERGYAELRNDGTLKGTEAGFRMLNRLKRQPNKVQIKGTPVAEMDDAALAEAAQSHPMSAFRQAAQDEIDRRANDSPQNVPSGSQFPNGERSQNENVRPQIGNDQVTATEPPPRTDTPAVGAPASQAPAVGQESIPAPSKPAESTASVPAVDAIAPSGAISANRATNPAISAASETILGKPVTDLTAKQLRQYAQMKGPKAEAAQAELDRRDLERQAKQGDTPSAKLLRVIAGFGGINTQHALDISGEKNALKLGGLRGRIFRKDGLGIDDVATYLHERGWITDTEYADVDGGTQRARDLIRNAIDGRLEPILPADVEAEMRRGEAERALAAAEEEAAVEGLPASDAADIKDISEAFAVIPQSEWARLDELATTMSDAEWQAYVVKYAKELSNAGSQPENAQGDRSGEAAGAQAQAADAAPAEEIALVGETEEEIAAREAAEKQAADEASAAAKAADDKAKLAADRQAIKDRSAAAADTFQLGQSAEENLSGQRDLLAPANPLTAAAAALEQAAQAIRQSVESQQEPARKPVLSEPPRTTVASTKVVEEFGDVSLRHDTEKDTWGAIWSNPRDSTTGGQWFKTEAEARERYAQMVKSEREKRDYASRQRRDRTLDLSRQMTVAEFDDIVERMRDGDITADEVRAGFERTVSGKDAITAELNKFTKDRLLRMTSSFHARPSDKKDVLVRSVYSTMLSTFDITTTGISYNPMERDGYAKALRSKIEALTDDDVKAFAERVSARRAEREERTKVALGAIENPQTLEDFETFLRVKKFSDMTPEQLERYDELRAEKGRERRKQADAQRGRVEAASQAVGAQIIETKHTKKGHDLFVVQLAQRVEREDYNRLNVAAKRLGGYYSSFRGGGAVPGFQFTTRANAEAFQQLAAGDTKAATEVVQERRATNREAKKSAAAERLAAMADKMEEAADESLSQDRLANTARRARMASSAEAQARANQQMARTLRAISDAIEEGRATNLDGIRNRKQVEELERLLQRAKNEAIRKEDPSGRHFEEQRHRAPRASDVTHVQYPQYDGYRSTFAEVARQVIQVQGGKMIGERLLRQTDDTKDYAKAVSAELGLLNKVLLGKRAQGEEASSAALFNRKADAEVAVRRSGMHRSAMVVPLTGRIGKGMYAVVLSPAEAKGRGLWAPKDDPRVRVSPELMEDILSKIDAHNERTRSWDRIHLAYMFDSVRESRKRLAGMGIENSSELRAALREYLRLRAEDAKQDRVRELERALAGNANVGFDFFPTPAPLAERMAEALEVEDGMTVLEPSAGKGNLADAVRALEPGAQIDVVEQSGTLREILEAKGYSLVGQDFNDFAPEEQYDRIIMNPPFSNGIDADHVRRAYDLLKPGGRLVAITGEGIFSRSDKKAEAFREWFDSVGGTAEQMEDAFTDRREVRTTSVRSRLLIIDKPGDATQEDDTAFSREKRGPAVRGMSVAQLQAEGAEVISKFTVPVIISESPQAAGKKAGIDVYDDAIAFAHDGNIHAIASAIPNPMLFEAAMWHEGTHIGLHLRYGRMSQAYKAAIDRVVLANKGIRDAAKAWREKYGADKAEAVKQANRKLSDNEIAEIVRYSSYEEALAEMSERRKGVPMKFIEQLALAIQRLMRAMGLTRLADFIESKSDAEALALLQHALGAVTKPNAQLRESAAPVYMRSITDGGEDGNRNGDGRGTGETDRGRRVSSRVVGDGKGERQASEGGVAEEERANAALTRSQTGSEALGGAGPVSARQTSVAKGRPNGDASDAKAITDLLKSEPFFLHGLGGIDIPSQRVVLDGVVALGDNREISDAVVELIPVDVMNILARKQLSPDVLFHDKAVLEDLLTADRKGSVSVARNVANALVRAIASVSAKYGLSSSGVSSGNREVGTASGAGVSDGFHAASMPQIKAVGNRGTFDPANPNIMFKRGASIVGGQDVLRSAHEFVSDTFRTSAKFNLYHRTFSTQQHKAEINEDFKQVYLEGQGLISDKSRYANEAADQAPDILPRPDSFKSFATAIKNALSQSDIKAVSDALMGGTLYGGGSPMEGRVWTDAQLKGEEVWVDNGTGGELVKVKMNLTDRQIKLYRQALAAVAHSLRDFSTSLLSRYARNLKVPFNREQSFDDAVASVQDAITEKIEAATERQNALKDLARDNGGYQDQIDAIGKQIQELEATRALVTDLEAKTNGLIEHGYFPASRFGQFTVYVTKGDEQIFFGRYDTEREANAAAREQKKLHPDAGVELGQINTERFKLFQGLSLDALETFANHMDVEDQPVVQEFLRVATAERSILRRQIHRKGTPGYSEDVPRVLAQFITSNAQATSANYHMAEMRRMANEIKDGDVAREATKLVDYLQNPVEEAAKFRSLLFLNFIGGSIAHGIVNLTQPIMQTAPVLSQHTSYANAAKQIMRAAKEYSKGAPLPKGLADAVKRAKDEGIVAPQEIHQLMAQSGPSLMGKSLKWRAAMHLWGSVYAITEQFNRGTTFIAAYRIAEADKKLGDPYEFAKGIVEQTQGVYNRGNRPNLGRSAVGATVLTFKQYSLAYMELMRRVYKNDKRAFAIMALTLIAAAGLEGLPFAEDAEDLIDTLGAWMGFATNSKKTLRRWAEGIVGKDWADFALHGVSAGLPVDVSQRLGFQNLIPGTGMLNPNQKNKAGDVVELLGPAGQFLPVDGTATGRMVERLSKGDLFGAGKAGAPVAIRNALAGAEMMQTGEARDTKGKKIIDVGAQDAAFKMIGLQPSKVASASRRMGEIMDDKAIRDAREARIAELWAQGVSERRPDLVAEAREELRQWNADNDPEYRIRISAQQIYSRVRAMKQTRDQRTVKSAPPEMRAYVRRELADR